MESYYQATIELREVCLEMGLFKEARDCEKVVSEVKKMLSFEQELISDLLRKKPAITQSLVSRGSLNQEAWQWL